MKKLLVILFALGLVFSFSAPVMATDISTSGSFRVRGYLDSNSALMPDENTDNAYYDQRLRVKTVFKVADGLQVVARFDALDGIWGRPDLMRSDATTSQDNLQFDMAYMQFTTAIGRIQAGWMSDGVWGTGFGDCEVFTGKITFLSKVDNVYLYLNTTKRSEGDRGNQFSDHDNDGYVAAAWYNDGGINAGLLYKYWRGADSAVDNLTTMNILIPYFKATFGDIYAEGEIIWIGGEIENAAGANVVDLEGLAAYFKVKMNLGPAYIGGLMVYAQGNDPADPTTQGGMANSGCDWNPCLILFNDTCVPPVGRFAGATTGNNINNGYIYQVFGGMSMDKLSVKASLSHAIADEAQGYVDDVYGTEFDLEAAYKIYDNLTYSVGFGYLWAGDWYKGTNAANRIDDTYLLMNKLQVNF
ncbi:MAG: hypothetical protein U9R20_03335 [Thermodesulfobacteriota bacterium]|nr:hypothetical protein [Thermodesulfobacteriota bacterium]